MSPLQLITHSRMAQSIRRDGLVQWQGHHDIRRDSLRLLQGLVGLAAGGSMRVL